MRTNAPRKAQVRDLLIALSERRVEDVTAELAADVEWDVVGSVTHRGRDDVARAIGGPPDRSLHLRNLLSHGKQVAAEGTTTSVTRQAVHFAHVVTYSGHGKSAKVRSIITYRIDEVPGSLTARPRDSPVPAPR